MDAQRILVPIALFAMIFGIIFSIVYLRSKENMALIERGINPKNGNGQPKPFSQPRLFIGLKFGLFLTGIGLGLLAAYIIDVIVLKHGVTFVNNNVFDRYGYRETQQENSPAIYFALIAIGGGLGLITSYIIEKKHWLDKIKKEDNLDKTSSLPAEG
jgi:hypothetical protein